MLTKKNFLKIVLIISALPLMAVRCGEKDEPNCHTRILFYNTSEKDIYLTQSYSYPDTTSYRWMFLVNESGWSKAVKKQMNDQALKASIHFSTCWEVIFENDVRIPSDTVLVFVFDAELLEQNPSRDAPWRDEMLLRRYDLSLADLQALDFRLYYPPTERMRNMKMYPPYGQ